jgi:tRNA modification GTPase
LSASDQDAVARNPARALHACLLTAAGRGAVATIRLSGNLAILDQAGLFRPRNGRPLPEQAIGTILFGHWCSSGGGVSAADDHSAEEVVGCRTAAGEFELHCHGGDAAVERIIDDLRACGAEIRSSGDAPWRHPDPLIAGCERALLAASTKRAALVLMSQHELWSRELDRWTYWNADQVRERVREIASWQSFAERLTVPAKIVLCGRPNVGKSSLMNAIAGFSRSIVHSTPGTTRDVVTLETAIDGWPVRLSDTAGLRDTPDPLEAEGVRRARLAVAEADLVIGLFDLSVPPTADDAALWDDLPPGALRVGNKCDLKTQWPADRTSLLIQVSAATGEGVAALLSTISSRLVSALPPADLPLPVSPDWRMWIPESFLHEAGENSGVGGTAAEDG